MIIEKVDNNELSELKAKFDSSYDSAMKTDSNESLILAEALTHVESQLVRVVKPMFNARNLMSVDSSGDPVSDSFKYYELRNSHGQAKWVDSWGDGSIPTVNASLRQVMGQIKGFALSATWTEDEVRKIRAANANRRSGEPAIGLEQELMLSIGEGMSDFENNVLLYGDADRGIQGFMNNDNLAPAFVVPAGAGGSTAWKDKTPQEVERDLHDLTFAQFNLTKGAERPNRLVLSNTMFQYISTTNLSVDNDKKILKSFLENNPYINSADQVMSMYEFERNELDADMADLFKDRGIGFCYNNAPTVLVAKIPMPMNRIATFVPDQSNPFSFRALYLERIGGVSIRKPQAILRFSGHEANS